MPTPLLVALITTAQLLSPTAPTPAATVCFLACDALDPSQAREEEFPVPEKRLNGRLLVLHVSDADGMAWGSIDEGTPGDSVWLDRSWDGGVTWEPLLGRATVPGTRTGTRTLMHNVSDPAGHRRGLIRACGDAGAVACTDWIYPVVCDVLCDHVDASLAAGDVQPVAPTTLHGRTIRLHVDARAMAWGTVEAGGPGDEVWLDRSWDEGASWPGGSSLGRTAVISGTSTRTTMFATRDPRGRHYGGAVRACGRAAGSNEGSCTAWARPAPTRADGAAEALMYSYRPHEGWWASSWWNSAATLTALVDYAARTGNRRYDWVVARTFDVNRGVFPAGQRGSDPIEGDFVSRAIDDSAWWGLAWIAAYDHTGERRYLGMAATIGAYVHQYWDTRTCGGGVWWDRERTYKNAVTAGLYVRLAASLHRRLPGDAVWSRRTRTAADWYLASGMINSAGLVNDGLTADCRNNGSTVWTYNQGLGIGGLTEAWRATGDARYLAAARRLADVALVSPVLTRGGVLTESCDVGQRSCDDNQKQFKGIFARYLADLARVTGSAAHRAYAQRQSDSIWTTDRDALNRLGQRWAGGTPNQLDWRTQASALGGVLVR
ncbi:putative alpha-1,6-mannanase (GH76 family) [Saccharothrix coeruleofusca]|uniref:glycoside hydrolase family 76 protein n=1 Tax=Saccharothrix coeruleofusca TaxID=33919 RepID=UPI001AE67645|nr:glycoside hydrolase family 76 protein [Saccharothrix coeruleofusca]MBP2336837.1 putative alpha-1,6-mannanase (GH76 family) [Saccharothrix coeruleofusca]